MRCARKIGHVLWALGLLGLALPSALAQELDDSCVVSLLNRSANVQADGSWQLFNVPAGLGLVRVRATCVRDGETLSGQSNFIDIDADIRNGYSPFGLGEVDPVPESISLSASSSVLTAAGQTVQVTVLATLPDGSRTDVTAAAAGTSYTVTNRAVATVDTGAW